MAGLLIHKNGEIIYLHKGLGWAGDAAGSQDQGREVALPLEGEVLGRQKEGMEAISETATGGGSACGC